MATLALADTEPAIAAYDRYLSLLRAGRDAPLEKVLSSVPLQETLAQIDQLKGWLDSFRPLPPVVVAEMRRQAEVRFTYHSNAMEGNTLTQSETEMVLEHGLTIGGKTVVEHLEAIGHREAIGYIEELSHHYTPVGEREIRDLHSLLLRTVDQISGTQQAGRYRTLDVRSAGTGHVYPPHYRLPELRGKFIEWLGSEANKQHPVAFAAEAHYRFVAIHPFADGNGRTGRLLMNLLLLRYGYPIALSHGSGAPRTSTH